MLSTEKYTGSKRKKPVSEITNGFYLINYQLSELN